jgi:hypothetical protein
MSAAATISAFTFLVLPKFYSADRHSISPITVDLFLPDHEVAAPAYPRMTDRLAASAKRRGSAVLSNSNQSKFDANEDAGGGAKTLAASGHS